MFFFLCHSGIATFWFLCFTDLGVITSQTKEGIIVIVKKCHTCMFTLCRQIMERYSTDTTCGLCIASTGFTNLWMFHESFDRSNMFIKSRQTSTKSYVLTTTFLCSIEFFDCLILQQSSCCWSISPFNPFLLCTHPQKSRGQQGS